MLNEVLVIGAAGKMGRGIALTLLQEMGLKKLANPDESFQLYLVDSNHLALDSVRSFLREHLKKFAEKKINRLRRLAESRPLLVSNSEIIEAFIEGGMDSLWFSKVIPPAKVVFEAISEDIEAKAEIFKNLKADLILTNTSSIPIHILQEKTQSPVIGFHFYNPPQVQNLVELAFAENAPKSVRESAFELVKTLHKQAVVSKDVAGFIGNGHFIREVNAACQLVAELAKTHPLYQAVYMVNKVTGDFLLRPMGIFELIDYIGFDTCAKIASIMSLSPPLFKEIKGGFFHYQNHVPVAVLETPMNQWVKECDQELGPFPEGYAPWKKFPREKTDAYLKALFQAETKGARLAQQFLGESRKIAKKLVEDGVAQSINDVNTVLMEGFHHLYGVPA